MKYYLPLDAALLLLLYTMHAFNLKNASQVADLEKMYYRQQYRCLRSHYH